MKTIIKTITTFAFTLLLLSACSDWTEPKKENYFAGQTPDYYENLKAYKRSDHIVTFGWFGNWTATGASMMNSMMGLPDSVDFVSVWGNWHLTPAQMADKQLTKSLKGTKMKLCFIIAEIGVGATPPEATKDWQTKYPTWQDAVNAYWGWIDNDNAAMRAALAKYAKALSDSCYKYDYDGFDWDLEPNYDGSANVLEPLWGYADRRDMFIEEMSKYFGPRSKTGRTLGVDGEPYLIRPDLYDAMDWFILQAYNNTSYSNLDDRANNIVNRFLTAENREKGVTKKDILKKIIFTENFETHYANGGVNHSLREGGATNSLRGMALWRSVEGYKAGGIGTFHMEYDYPNIPEYKWLRAATTAANPPVL